MIAPAMHAPMPTPIRGYRVRSTLEAVHEAWALDRSSCAASPGSNILPALPQRIKHREQQHVAPARSWDVPLGEEPALRTDPQQTRSWAAPAEQAQVPFTGRSPGAAQHFPRAKHGHRVVLQNVGSVLGPPETLRPATSGLAAVPWKTPLPSLPRMSLHAPIQEAKTAYASR